MDELIRLIKQISLILLQEKTQQEERRKRGECFNIFEVLGLQTSEVRLHSAIIAELLNPDGNHGLGDKFLKAFVENVIGKQMSFSIDTASAKVFVEYPIGTINEDYTEGGRIDLLIRDKNKQTIIIENKIYAGDQYCQLLRYNNFACKTENLSNDKYIILYLTLHDGGQPSEDSIGEEPFEYYCISYKTDILTWLEHCLELSTRQPLVRETIQQYIINLKSILSIMNIENRQKLLETMAANPEAVAAICNMQRDYSKFVYDTFVKPKFAEFASKNNLIFKETNLFAPRGERGFYFYRKEWTSAAIWFYTWKSGESEFIWGVSNYSGDGLQIEETKLDCLENSPDKVFPYGTGNLGQYTNWDMNTFTEMVKGNYVEYITSLVDTALDEIDRKGLPMP